MEHELPAIGSTGTMFQPDTEPLPATTQLLPAPQTSPSDLYFPLRTEATHAGEDDSTASALNCYGVGHAGVGPFCEKSGRGGEITYGETFSSCVAEIRMNETCNMSELGLFGDYLWE